MPLFPVKKSIFDWISQDKKTVEIRTGRLRKGTEAVFRSGRNVVKRRIIETREGRLRFLLLHYGFKRAVPTVHTLEEALAFHKTLGHDLDAVYTAYVLASPDSVSNPKN